MAYFVCPDTHIRHFLFGSSHAAEITQAAGVSLLAQLPIIIGISDLCDRGKVEDVNFPEMADLLSNFFQVMPVQVHKNYERS